MKITSVPISSLKFDPENARRHSAKNLSAIKGSLTAFGQQKPIVVSKGNYVVAGNGTLAAAKELGWDEINVVKTDLEPELAKAFALADNRTSELAEWDDEILKLSLAELDLAGFDIESIGFDPVDGILAPGCDEDEIPEVKETSVVRGSIYNLGSHRLMCGDSTSLVDVEKLMNGEKAEFCFTSPPYSDQRDYGGNLNLSPGHLSLFFNAPCKLWAVNLGLKRLNKTIEPYWDIYIKMAQQHNLPLLSWNVWDKGECGSVGNQTAMFGISHEWIFILGEYRVLNRTIENKSAGELANHNGNRQKDGSIKKQKDRIVGNYSQLKTVLSCVPQKARDEVDHPARFPVELAETYIEACSNRNEIVYEPFTGSGSTLIACEKTNRKCYGMEIDPQYCQVIIDRWQKYTGKVATLLTGN